MSANLGDQNYIYLYDLPKDDLTSQKIAQVFETQGKVSLSAKPQIRRDLTRPFYSGIVQIKDPQQFSDAAEAMRYFQINGKWCRALKFQKQILGSNKEKLVNNNVFVRSIDKQWSHQDLHTKFANYGPIMSCKISMNHDHTSRGYGFVCFQDEQSATDAIAQSGTDQSAIGIKCEMKQTRNIFSVINNVYVKNIPDTMTDDEVKEMFKPFGHIASMVLSQNPNVKGVKFGFVCYSDPNVVDGTVQPADKAYGPKCAQAAIEGLHGRKMDDNLQLYVRAAMNKEDRQNEKVRETLRYKQSKKRCNLYVKNFPGDWNEDKLKELFEQFGETEKGGIKIQKPNSNNVFAFVCFKTPDSAAMAKQTLHNHNIDGKTLMINHYEIKEFRDLQKEEAMDKQGYEQYMAQKTGGFHLNDLSTHPHLTQILQQLLEIMQHNDQIHQGPFQQQRGGHQNRGGYNNRGGNYQNRGHHSQNYQGQRNQGGQGGMPGQQPNMPMPPQGNMNQPGMPPKPAAPQGPPGMPMAPQQMNPQQMQQLPVQQRYIMTTSKILPSCNEKNPHMKDQVGQAIFEYVSLLVPKERAPKITGMLIEIPVPQIQQYLQQWEIFAQKVNEANTLIDNASQQQQQ